jgi:hypothetical protein
MNRLAGNLNLFDRRYDDLLTLGRSRLPALAPGWTDYNAHDPGITLMELLAWVAEAQIYALARSRRDERAAYAALFGVAPRGTIAAQGLIWADTSDPGSPAALLTQSQVIPLDSQILPLNRDMPVFRPASRLLWVPGRINRLEATSAGGRKRDLTSINERGGPVYLPFGDTAGVRDLLRVHFECRGDQGLFPPVRDDAAGALLSLGVRADSPAAGASGSASQPGAGDLTPLVVTLESDGGRYPLRVVADSSFGMMRTGAILLDLTAVEGSPVRFALEIRARGGFPRPPRLQRLDLNVLPIVQGFSTNETNEANGLPDFSFVLSNTNLRYDAGQDPVQIAVERDATRTVWRRCESLSDQGPGDAVFEFDATAARATFGNGINGRIPATGDRIVASYSVSDGASGNLPRNRQWHVLGFEGSFGTNPDAITGGSPAADLTSLRRDARSRSRDDRPIVTQADLVLAARELPFLEVARAWLSTPAALAPQTGEITLVAMRARPGGVEPDRVPETRVWLETIRRRLVGRITLGTRLKVIGPNYVPFQLSTTLIALPGRDPKTIQAAALDSLQTLVMLVDVGSGAPRMPGVPVTLLDVTAWLRKVDGVARVADVQFALATGERVDQIAVPANGFPRLDAQPVVTVQRAGSGVTP